MSRPLARLLPPEHPGAAGGGGAPGPQFGGSSSSNPTGSAPNGGHLTSMASLKSLLQLPIKVDPRAAKDCCEMKDKDKPPDPEEETLGPPPGGPAGPGGAPPGAGPLRSSSQSAFLGPLLWERTLPCDGGLFQLQYMDLEEFLTENGMGMHNGPSSATAQIPSQPAQSIMGGPECLHAPPPVADADGNNNSSEVQVNFDPDPADLALSSVPGQEAFDPRRHRFSDEELKPQPMIKKARKMLVPNEQKDDKYWSRRYKNNEAAKRSRDARRLKENQITVRAAFLERENATLRQEVADMRKELGRCRNILNKYESRHGDL
ncbi:hypothetical protein NHX12_023709 [Muraenolepis orangiensis]|uniref:BZIP domain-containing protein n=1 Tax=Muraenolepis orangiensis TaxID=630683 RepID=A0A9Q0EPB9_9TELE|nr:hypothetical protein NHX12_023709 [Muraenolepis orangiensis]